MAYCTTKPCLKLILSPWPFSNPGKLRDHNCEEKRPIKSLLGEGIWHKLQIHCIEILQYIITRILDPHLTDSVETEIGFRSLAGEVIHKSTTVALSHIGRCVHLSVQLSRYFLHTYLGFYFQELQQFLVFCSSSLCHQHLIVGNSYHRAESLEGSWSHLPVASMAGSSLTPSCFTLGSVQWQTEA